MNYREIGRALGINEGNVKVRVFRARERLTALLRGITEPVVAADNSIADGAGTEDHGEEE